jgi:hypothetical protein
VTRPTTVIAFVGTSIGLAALAGCGGGTPTSAPAAAPAAAKAHVVQAVAVAPARPPATRDELAGMLVAPLDFPGQWFASDQPAKTPQEQADVAKESADFATCVGTRDTGPEIAAEAESPNYTRGPWVVSSSASSFATADAVKIDTGVVSNPKLASCLDQEYRTDLTRDGLSVESLSVHVTPGAFNGIGDTLATTDATGVVVSSSGNRVPVTIRQVLVAGDNVEGNVTFISFGEALPTTLLEEVLVSKVVTRIAAAGR